MAPSFLPLVLSFVCLISTVWGDPHKAVRPPAVTWCEVNSYNDFATPCVRNSSRIFIRGPIIVPSDHVIDLSNLADGVIVRVDGSITFKNSTKLGGKYLFTVGGKGVRVEGLGSLNGGACQYAKNIPLAEKPHLFRSLITDGIITEVDLISAPSTALVIQGRNVTAARFKITDCNKGIEISTSLVNIKRVDIQNATEQGIHIATGSHIIIERGSGDRVGKAVLFGPVGASQVIEDVDVFGHTVIDSDYGYYLESIAGETGGIIRNVIVSAGSVSGFTQAAISVKQNSGATFSNITFRVVGGGDPVPKAPTIILSCSGGCKNVSVDKVDIRGGPAKCTGITPLPTACTLAASQATEGLVVGSTDPQDPHNVAVRITNPPSAVPPWATAMLALGSTLIVMVVIILVLLATTSPKRRIEEL